MYEDLIWFKSLDEFFRFFLCNFLGPKRFRYPKSYNTKINIRNITKRCEICLKFTIETPRGVSIVNFKHISHLFVMFLILILVLYDLGYRKRFGPKKLHKKKRKNSSRLLNHIKSSYIIFCPELFQYSLCIYIHIYILLIKKYQNILGQKNHTRKIEKFD